MNSKRASLPLWAVFAATLPLMACSPAEEEQDAVTETKSSGEIYNEDHLPDALAYNRKQMDRLVAWGLVTENQAADYSAQLEKAAKRHQPEDLIDDISYEMRPRGMWAMWDDRRASGAKTLTKYFSATLYKNMYGVGISKQCFVTDSVKEIIAANDIKGYSCNDDGALVATISFQNEDGIRALYDFEEQAVFYLSHDKEKGEYKPFAAHRFQQVEADALDRASQLKNVMEETFSAERQRIQGAFANDSGTVASEIMDVVLGSPAPKM
ncbi:MAG: hypothetical protein H6867_11350 [Rhodospirillales bacterium]|nr:hypothetical protein [Rhodospirillales bacterium]MCB9996725.1 hypothetical protein [Rhodospirillales bacterium]